MQKAIQTVLSLIAALLFFAGIGIIAYVEAYDYQKILVTMDMPNEDVRYQLLKELRDMNSSAYIESDIPISRNSPCPCGSGKRYKHCCGKTK